MPSNKLPATIAAKPDVPKYGAIDCIMPPKPEIKPAVGRIIVSPKLKPVLTSPAPYDAADKPATVEALAAPPVITPAAPPVTEPKPQLTGAAPDGNPGNEPIEPIPNELLEP